ncbi:Protein CBG17859 [Caenorhabditis briggsae]|uniref:Protein CBG17859 n=1 Tax=Caenorhabditis briggsae TaxID=6238 RepID=A8XRX8_CAEBR|nr:Protein CBG17859 [Caenorhabditis briggsae]CAP35404.2 Protein CBG17859 [Caenorhabditis briggsae]
MQRSEKKRHYADFQNIYSSPQFSVMLSPFFTSDEQIVMKSYLMVDAILTKKDLTTKLIVFLSFTFFLTEAPLGVIYLVKVFYRRNDPISILSTDFVIYFTLLVTVNSILHPIFCVFMSSQYRNTIRTMCGVTKKAKTPVKNKTSAVSVQGIQMT